MSSFQLTANLFLSPAYLPLICSADRRCQVSANLVPAAVAAHSAQGALWRAQPLPALHQPRPLPGAQPAAGVQNLTEVWNSSNQKHQQLGRILIFFPLITANTLGQATQDAVNQITEASQKGRSNDVQIKMEQLNTSQKRPVLILLCPTGVLSLEVLGFSDHFV